MCFFQRQSKSELKLRPKIFVKVEVSACGTPGVLRVEWSLNTYTFHTTVNFFGKIVIKKGTF